MFFCGVCVKILSILAQVTKSDLCVILRSFQNKYHCFFPHLIDLDKGTYDNEASSCKILPITLEADDNGDDIDVNEVYEESSCNMSIKRPAGSGVKYFVKIYI